MSALASRVANSYNQALNKHPILTNSATGFVLACLGDIVTQKYLAEEEKKRRLQTIIKTSSSKGLVAIPRKHENKAKNTEVSSWWRPGRTLEMGVIRAAVGRNQHHQLFPLDYHPFTSVHPFRFTLTPSATSYSVCYSFLQWLPLSISGIPL